jgi:nitrogen fixation NifU-like protein
MTNELLGKTTEEAILLFNVFHEMLTREDFSEKNIFVDSFFKKAGVFLNIKNFPTRVKCATLAWHSFNLALKENKPQQNDNIN